MTITIVNRGWMLNNKCMIIIIWERSQLIQHTPLTSGNKIIRKGKSTLCNNTAPGQVSLETLCAIEKMKWVIWEICKMQCIIKCATEMSTSILLGPGLETLWASKIMAGFIKISLMMISRVHQEKIISMGPEAAKIAQINMIHNIIFLKIMIANIVEGTTRTMGVNFLKKTLRAITLWWNMPIIRKMIKAHWVGWVVLGRNHFRIIPNIMACIMICKETECPYKEAIKVWVVWLIRNNLAQI